jgi:hypothetical protein
LQELARVLAAPAFAGALAHQRLLRHLVEQTLAGQADTLKETVLGIEVFQRPAHSFDPRRDSIVRVEARRLRQRLQQHYQATPGGTLMIVLPTGSYRPQFVLAQRVGPTACAGAPKNWWRGATSFCARATTMATARRWSALKPPRQACPATPPPMPAWRAPGCSWWPPTWSAAPGRGPGAGRRAPRAGAAARACRIAGAGGATHTPLRL